MFIFNIVQSTKTYRLKKTRGLSLKEIYKALRSGGCAVTYGYCVSIFALTFRLASSPHFIKPGEPLSKYRWSYTLRSLLLGWWGLPWGPIYTISMIRVNYKDGGGTDITDEVMSLLREQYPDMANGDVLTEDLKINFHLDLVDTTKENHAGKENY
jgi:hypothetical protein